MFTLKDMLGATRLEVHQEAPGGVEAKPQFTEYVPRQHEDLDSILGTQENIQVGGVQL